jgi:hypothetical protein
LPHFERYIGIDYSGAETPDSSCKGLRIYVAVGSGTPEPIQPRKCRQRRRFSNEGRDGDEQAAFAVAAWLQRADRDGSLDGFFRPNLTAEEREVAAIECWIFGVV